MAVGRARRLTTKGRSWRFWSCIAAAAIAVAGLVTAGTLVPQSVIAEPKVAAAVFSTAPDAQQTAYAAPDAFVTAMTAIATDHNSILLGRIAGNGTVTTTTDDLTPRTSSGQVLEVPDRINAAIDESIKTLMAEMNRASPGTTSRELYAGLLQARVPKGVPVWIFSSGIDLGAPDDARALAWDVPVADVVKTVNDAKAVPDLQGADVTFVMTAPAGGQEIRSTDTQYIHDLWSALLQNAGTKSVTFIDMPSGKSASDQKVPIVPLPALPSTPVPPQPTSDGGVTCTLGAVYFVYGTNKFTDKTKTRANLQDCVAAMKTATAITVTGTVSYEGGFDAQGKPLQPDFEQPLAQARATRVAIMLANDFGIPSPIITAQGFGGVNNQPYPQDPTSPNNRAVVISATGITTPQESK